LCDRLLLAGFLSAKQIIGIAEVNDVVSELTAEGAVGASTSSGWGELTNSGSMPLAVDTSRLSLDAASADAISQHLGSLASSQQGDRLLRLERSLLRLEQVNGETLELLKKLVKAVRKDAADGGVVPKS
jgi:hypothetical protein